MAQDCCIEEIPGIAEQRFQIVIRDRATGNVIDTYGKINLGLKDTVPPGQTVGLEIKLREIDVCVDGVAKKMIVLCSLPYAAP